MKVWNKGKAYIVLGLSIFLSFIIIYGIGLQDNIRGIQISMQLLIIFGFIVVGAVGYNKKIEIKHLIYLVIWIGMVMRIGYMLYTPIDVRAHDLGEMSIEGNGHFAYIAQILEGKLPTTNQYQFYHPPFFHFLAAITSKFINYILRKEDLKEIIEAAKMVSCFASCGMLMMTVSICEEFHLSEKGKLGAVSFIAFLPNFYLLAGRINNDALAIFFIFVIVLYTARWYQEATYKNSILLALAFGFGMMTKISVGIMALYTGSIMLYVLVKSVRKKEGQHILRQLVIFSGICFPIALWYPIRNYLLFGQTFSYVPKISINDPKYCGDYLWWQRFLGVPFNKGYSLIYNSPYHDYNTNLYLIKGALFGEFTFETSKLLSATLLVFFSVLILGSVYIYINLLYKYARSRTYEIVTLYSITIIMYFSYVLFNIQYPFGCTMDYRYVVPLALMNSLALGMQIDTLVMEENKSFVYINNAMIICLIIFSMLSVVMFCNIGPQSTVLIH